MAGGTRLVISRGQSLQEEDAMTTRSTRAWTVAIFVAASAFAAAYAQVRAQVVTPRPDQLRFEALLNEPISTPDHRAVVAGTSALLVKDRRTGQGYVAVTVGRAMGVAPAACTE
jgi:hypothetical protein